MAASLWAKVPGVGMKKRARYSVARATCRSWAMDEMEVAGSSGVASGETTSVTLGLLAGSSSPVATRAP